MDGVGSRAALGTTMGLFWEVLIRLTLASLGKALGKRSSGSNNVDFCHECAKITLLGLISGDLLLFRFLLSVVRFDDVYSLVYFHSSV